VWKRENNTHGVIGLKKMGVKIEYQATEREKESEKEGASPGVSGNHSSL